MISSNLRTKTNGMTASKYIHHLSNFAYISTFLHKPDLALRALKYYKLAEKCVPQKIQVINLVSEDFCQKTEQEKETNTTEIEEKVFYPVFQRHFDLLKKNYRYALRIKKLSLALQILKEIGEQIGLDNKANHTKPHCIIRCIPKQSEK